MSTKPKPARATAAPKATIVLPNPAASASGEPHAADSPSRRSEPHVREIGGSGLALWDEGLLVRTMQALRPPTLRDGETVEQHRTEIAGCAGIAISAFRPKDAVEAMIASQAVALHHASLECARRAMLPEQQSDVASKLRKDAANPARAMVDMVEALQRYRGTGPQVIRVERMVVADGGQAVVGNVTAGASLPSSAPAPRAIERGAPPMATPDALPDVVAVDRGEG